MSKIKKGISEKDKKAIIKAYKAFYDKCMNDHPSELTSEELKAIGKNVYDKLLEKAFDRFDEEAFTEEDKKEIYRELEELIRSEFSDTLWDTQLKWSKSGFKNE